MGWGYFKAGIKSRRTISLPLRSKEFTWVELYPNPHDYSLARIAGLSSNPKCHRQFVRMLHASLMEYWYMLSHDTWAQIVEKLKSISEENILCKPRCAISLVLSKKVIPLPTLTQSYS